MSDQRKTKTAVGMILIIFAAKCFGLLREVLLAHYYGTGIYTDAYVIANNVPTVIFAAVGVALSSAFIPMFSRIKQKEGEERAVLFTQQLTNVLVLLCLAITLLGVLFSPQIVRLFAVGFTGEVFEVTVRFTRILMPCIIATAMLNIFSAYLQIKGEFFAYSFVPITCNAVIAVSIWAAATLGQPDIMAIGTLVGNYVQIFYYSFYLRRHKYRHRLRWPDRKDPYVRELLILVLPVFAGEAAHEINMLVDRTLASTLETGSLSALNYAYRIIQLLTGVLIAPLVAIAYPQLSALAAAGRKEEFNREVNESMNTMVVIIPPIMGVVFVLASLLVKILFERGSFNEWSTQMTASALIGYTIGLLGIGLRDVLVKAFYACKNTRIPMVNGIISSGLNILLDLLLMRVLGHFGLALATSIAMTAAAALLMFLASRKGIARLQWKRLFFNLAKTAVAAVFSSGLLYWCYKQIAGQFDYGVGMIALAFFAVGLSLVCYVLFQWMLRNHDVVSFVVSSIKMLKSRFGKGQ